MFFYYAKQLKTARAKPQFCHLLSSKLLTWFVAYERWHVSLLLLKFQGMHCFEGGYSTCDHACCYMFDNVCCTEARPLLTCWLVLYSPSDGGAWEALVWLPAFRGRGTRTEAGRQHQDTLESNTMRLNTAIRWLAWQIIPVKIHWETYIMPNLSTIKGYAMYLECKLITYFSTSRKPWKTIKINQI